MPASFSLVYVHLVWATWDREPILTADIRDRVFRCILAECNSLGARGIEVGGTDDHVHLLVRLPATVSVAQLAKQVKGASSHFVSHELCPAGPFRWQGAYGAFSVGPDSVEDVRRYIARQMEHHADGTADARWEQTMEQRVRD